MLPPAKVGDLQPAFSREERDLLAMTALVTIDRFARSVGEWQGFSLDTLTNQGGTALPSWRRTFAAIKALSVQQEWLALSCSISLNPLASFVLQIQICACEAQ